MGCDCGQVSGGGRLNLKVAAFGDVGPGECARTISGAWANYGVYLPFVADGQIVKLRW